MKVNVIQFVPPQHPTSTSNIIMMKLWLVLVIFLSGCTTTHTNFLSEHWVEQPTTLHFVSTNTQPSRLQVIITYDGALSSHSALRLESSTGHTTFWDPAGAYGLVGHFTNNRGERIHPYGKRERDIIMTHIPDIPTYMNFRWFVGDSSVEIFEWDLQKEETEEIREVLQNETDEQHPKGEFRTETTAAFCSIAISDFLQRFLPPTIKLADTYLWPHNLADALLQQSPSRIRVFIPGQEEKVFVPPLSQIVGP